MTLAELDAMLDVAINAHDNEAYAAAARAHWPLALMELRDAKKALAGYKQLGDALARAAHEYMVAYVKQRGVDDAARTLVLATEAYRTPKLFGAP